MYVEYTVRYTTVKWKLNFPPLEKKTWNYEKGNERHAHSTRIQKHTHTHFRPQHIFNIIIIFFRAISCHFHTFLSTKFVFFQSHTFQYSICISFEKCQRNNIKAANLFLVCPFFSICFGEVQTRINLRFVVVKHNIRYLYYGTIVWSLSPFVCVCGARFSDCY